MEGRKRKREVDTDQAEDAIITFHAPNGRTFSRIFKDRTLAKTRETVRKKLDLAPGVKFELSQLRNGKRIDLEDDDDFIAFRALARTNPSLDIQVTVVNQPPSPLAGHVPNSTVSGHVREPSTSSLLQVAKDRDRVVEPARNGTVSVDTKSSPAPTAQKEPATDAASRKKAKKDKRAIVASDMPSGSPIGAEEEDAPPRKKKRKNAPREEEQPIASSSKAPVNQLAASQSQLASPAVTGGGDVPVERNPDVQSKSSAKKNKKASKAAVATTDGILEPKKKKKKGPEDTEVVSPPPEPVSEPAVADGDSSSKKRKKKKGRDASAQDQTAPDNQPPAEDTSSAPKAAKSKKKSKEARPVQPPPTASPPESSVPAVSVPNATQTKKSHQAAHAAASAASNQSSRGNKPSESGLPSTVNSAEAQKKSKEAPNPSQTGQVASTPKPQGTKGGEKPAEPLKPSKPPPKLNGRGNAVDSAIASILAACAIKPSATGIQPAQPQTSTSAKAVTSSLSLKPSPPVPAEPPHRSPPVPVSSLPPPPPLPLSPSISSSSLSSSSPAAASSSPAAASAPTPVPAPALTSAPVAVPVPAITPASAPSAPPSPGPTSTPASTSPLRAVSTDELVPAPLPTEKNRNAEQAQHTESVDDPDNTNPAAQSANPPKRSGGKRPSTNGVRCPVCFTASFHLRFKCPVVTAGPESIKRRIAELSRDPTKLQLQRELEHILGRIEKPQVPSSPPKAAAGEKGIAPSDDDVGNGSLFASRSQSPEVPLPKGIPPILTGSEISEVVVQGKSDDSSESSSSDEEDVDAAEDVASGATFTVPVNPTEADLEALLRGPTSSLNLADVLNKISAKGDDSSDSEGSEPEDMASEEEARNEKAFRRMSQQIQRRAPSSDEEESDEEQGTTPNNVPMDVDQDAEVPSSAQPNATIGSSSNPVPPVLLVGTTADRDVEMLEAGKAVIPSSEDEEEPPLSLATQSLSRNQGEPPDVPMSPPQHEEDAIEPSEEPESHDADEDPIEVDMSQAALDNSVPPPTPLPKRASARKMKDRNGNTKATSASAKQNAPSAPSEADVPKPAVSAAPSVEPTPSAPAVTVTAKRRGRPPLSAEVKAERARIAAEKKAEKEAEKRAQREGKARQKPTSKPTKAGKVGDVPVSGNTTAKASAQATGDSSQAAVADTNGWETLPATPSAAETMIDELRSSSPGDTEERGNKGAKVTEPILPIPSEDGGTREEPATPLVKTAGATSATPLFLPASQAPLHGVQHSQLNGASPLTQRGSASQVGGPVKSAMRPVSAWKFPRLSDIASQGMFSPLSAHPVPPRPIADQQKKTFDKAFGGDDSSSESSSSDSEEEALSHIPPSRRAGAPKK